MSSRDTAPSNTFMDNWSGSILCSRNRPTYRCNRYRQHLFCRFSVQKLNHDIVCGTCTAVCGVYDFFYLLLLLFFSCLVLHDLYNIIIYSCFRLLFIVHPVRYAGPRHTNVSTYYYVLVTRYTYTDTY